MRRPLKTGDRTVCRRCSGVLIAHCGSIYVHHWTHAVDTNCDPAPETEWHRAWKDHVHESRREVAMERDGERRRADIQLVDGRVIELQHGCLNVEEIIARERFYVHVFWIYDGVSIGWERIHYGRRGGFWWKKGPKSLTFHERPVWIDTGEYLAIVRLALVNGGKRVVGKVLRRVTYGDFHDVLRRGGVEAEGVPMPWSTGQAQAVLCEAEAEKKRQEARREKELQERQEILLKLTTPLTSQEGLKSWDAWQEEREREWVAGAEKREKRRVEEEEKARVRHAAEALERAQAQKASRRKDLERSADTEGAPFEVEQASTKNLRLFIRKAKRARELTGG